MMFQGQVAVASNRADFLRIYELEDEDTGDLIDLTSASIVFDITEPGCSTPRLTATTDNGKITLVDSTAFQVLIPLAEMKCLCAQTYEVGATIQNADFTESLIVGSLTVVDGGVPR